MDKTRLRANAVASIQVFSAWDEMPEGSSYWSHIAGEISDLIRFEGESVRAAPYPTIHRGTTPASLEREHANRAAQKIEELELAKGEHSWGEVWDDIAGRLYKYAAGEKPQDVETYATRIEIGDPFK